MPVSAFTLALPQRRDTAVVFASPHSGRAYRPDLMAQTILDDHVIRTSEDAFVDELLAPAQVFGAPVLCANVPRAFIDLNRGSDELDPAVIEGVRAVAHNPRVASGLGVIPRVVAGGRPIYRGKLPLATAKARIALWWQPYHDCLQRLLAESRADFGRAILIDVHSMPREAMLSLPGRHARRPDVVVGDRFGASASDSVVSRIEAAFAARGFTVARNAPFAGAYVAQAYGRPAMNQHVVQVELDRSLYMDEQAIARRADFDRFAQLLAAVWREVADIGREERRLAAE